MIAAFVVAVTFLMHPGVKTGVVSCPNKSCVRHIIAEALAHQDVAEVKVWEGNNFANLPASGKPVWPPIIRLQRG